MGTIFPMDFPITRQEEFKLFSYEPSVCGKDDANKTQKIILNHNKS